jgi:REP element-mobilizing transposase RayT
MSTAYQIIDQKAPYFITFQVVDWIDIFTRKLYKDIIIDCFKFMIDYKDFQLYAYVIMSNHIHLVAQGGGRLSDNIRDIKKFTSFKIIEAIKASPESRKEWVLKIFKANALLKNRIKNIKSGRMKIMQCYFLQTNS